MSRLSAVHRHRLGFCLAAIAGLWTATEPAARAQDSPLLRRARAKGQNVLRANQPTVGAGMVGAIRPLSSPFMPGGGGGGGGGAVSLGTSSRTLGSAVPSEDLATAIGINSMTGLVPPADLPYRARVAEEESKKVVDELRQAFGDELAAMNAPALGAGPGAAGRNASSRVFSWRSPINVVTPARDQGTVNTCWAFTTVAAFESAHAIANNKSGDDILRFSEQAVVDCSGAGDAVRGGWWAFSHLRDRGASLLRDRPYRSSQTTNFTGTSGDCASSTQFRALKLGYVSPANPFFPETEEIQQMLVLHGPIAAGVFATDAFMSHMGGQVFSERLGPGGDYPKSIGANHAVTIVGWHDDKQAWIIKNSYAENWGSKGFGYVRYKTNNIGYGAAWVDSVSDTPETRSKQLGAVREAIPSAASVNEDAPHTGPAETPNGEAMAPDPSIEMEPGTEPIYSTDPSTAPQDGQSPPNPAATESPTADQVPAPPEAPAPPPPNPGPTTPKVSSPGFNTATPGSLENPGQVKSKLTAPRRATPK